MYVCLRVNDKGLLVKFRGGAFLDGFTSEDGLWNSVHSSSDGKMKPIGA